MRKMWMIAALFLLIGATAPAQEDAAQESEADEATAAESKFASETEQLSYFIGVQFGKNLKSLEEDVDMQAMTQAMQDVLADKELKMNDQEMQAFAQKFQEKMMAKAEARQQAQDQADKDFLEENKQKEGVKVTDSGLQYEVVEEGTGKTPGPTDRVRAHYRGTFVDGEQFDSSYERGEPTEFPVNGVIKGWTEALQLMKEGGKMRIVVPGDLAYGPNPPPGMRPNATLIFTIELIEVLDTDTPAQAPEEGIMESAE